MNVKYSIGKWIVSGISLEPMTVCLYWVTHTITNRYYMGGRRLEDAVKESLSKGIKLMEQETGPFDPYNITTFIIFNILLSICFSYTVDIDDKYFTDVVHMQHIFNDEIGFGFWEDFIPPLRLFPTKRLRRMIAMVEMFFDYINTDIDKHKKTFSRDNIRDVCDAILLAQEEAVEEEDPEQLAKITDAHITQTVSDIFGAGIDTSRSVLIWCFLYLALNPDIQSKLHEEIDQVLGARKIPRLADRSNLPYTEAVYNETIRISSLAPLGLPHTAICDSKIGGYDIPKGTTVFTNLYAIHHDPEKWKDPEVFCPERFLDENGKMAAKTESYLPFSVGRRMCLGETVAKAELHLLLAGLMRHFKISLPPGAKINWEQRGGSFSNVANKYEVIFESRI